MSAIGSTRAYRKALVATASVVAVLACAPAALAQNGPGGAPPNPPGSPPAARFKPILLPAWGDLDPFYGDINAFWGDINPFWGDIDPFWGDIDPFWGDIDPFWGDIDPFWGDIDPFSRNPSDFPGEAPPEYGAIGHYWTDVGPLLNGAYANWGALGAYSVGAADYAALQTQLNTLVTQSEATWGAAVSAKTGQTFRAGFVDPLFARYGVNLDDPSTFAGLTASQRSHLFMDWYDGLMDYAGADHIDHWMAAVNWRPQITLTQGEGAGTIIGLLDATVAGDPDIANNITASNGYTNSLGGHGTSVASLMVAAHDGHGVMGIAPSASVVAYNPFDASGTASWADVHSGIVALQSAGASVVNMSLGVPNWTLHSDWKDALAGVNVQHTVFVVAAGNSGTSQSTDIAWNWNQNPALLVVGSVDGQNVISSFSNRPGTACLLDNGVCGDGHHLYDRFLVAPGEVILVSDGQGGLERRSGTSFAAPLVSGAIVLLHDRWPWLANYPHETADIILKSAKDLGAPGPDPVYGMGMLNVEASQSPLDFSALTFYEHRNGVITQRTAADVKAGGLQTSWEADNVFFYLFENLGATHRDFAVPMSSHLVGQKTNVSGSEEYFQSYITSRLTGWITGTGSFTDLVSRTSQQPGQWSFTATTGLPQAPMSRKELVGQAPHMGFRMEDPTGRFAFNFGRGEGAMVLGQAEGFSLIRDYTSADGGVNPMLGFASGGPFAGVDVALGDRTTLSVGGAERQLVHRYNPALTDLERDVLRNVDDYRAGAFNMRLAHRVTDALTVDASYTQLREANGLLGVQSTDGGDLRHGSDSRVVTLGASLDLPHGMSLAASASGGETRTRGGADQNLVSVGSAATSAYAVSFAKRGLFGKHDLVRFAVTQPLNIERGQLAYTSVEVVDRQTGEIGAVTHTFDISRKPRQVAETLYATPAFDGRGEVSVFGRVEFQSGEPVQDYMVGARLNLNY